MNEQVTNLARNIPSLVKKCYKSNSNYKANWIPVILSTDLLTLKSEVLTIFAFKGEEIPVVQPKGGVLLVTLSIFLESLRRQRVKECGNLLCCKWQNSLI